MIIGSDLDGTLCLNPLDKSLFRPYRLHEYYSRCIAAPLSRMHYDAIITGRRKYYEKLTREWLDKNRVEFDTLVMFPNKIQKSNISLARYKSNWINELSIDLFFDDDIYFIDIISDK